MSSKSVPDECQARVSSKSVLQECQVRVSNKKGVKQECHLSVSRQGVPQVGSLENVINKYCFCSSTSCRHSGSWVSSCFFTGFRNPPPVATGNSRITSRSLKFSVRYCPNNKKNTNKLCENM